MPNIDIPMGDKKISELLTSTNSETSAALNKALEDSTLLRKTFSRRITAGGWELKNPWPAAHPTPPTLTHATVLTSTGTRQNIASTDERIRRFGDYGSFSTADGKNSVSSTIAGYEFFVQGSAYVEITWYESVANASKLWFWLDDQPLTIAPAATIATGTGTRVFSHIALPDSGRHKIGFYGGDLGGIGTVYTAATATVSPVAPRLRLGWIGDSYSDGTSYSHEAVSHPFTVARTLNMELAPNSVGSTGYITGTQFWNSPTRLARMARSNPDVIVFDGSVNDPDTMTVAQVTAVYDSYASQHPGVPFIVFGPQPSSATSTLTQARATVNKTIRDAALAHPSVIKFIDVIGTADGILPAAWNSATTTYTATDKVTYLGSVWQATGTKGAVTAAPGSSFDWKLLSDGYFGTGVSGTPAANGNRDIVVAADGVHPTETGSNLIANNRALGILNALRGL